MNRIARKTILILGAMAYLAVPSYGQVVVETLPKVFEGTVVFSNTVDTAIRAKQKGTNYVLAGETVTNELNLGGVPASDYPTRSEAYNAAYHTNWPAIFPLYSNVVANGTANISYVNGPYQILACTGTTTAVFSDYPDPIKWVDYMITLIPQAHSLTVTGNVVLATGWKITNSAYGTPVLIGKSWGVTNRSVLYSIGE